METCVLLLTRSSLNLMPLMSDWIVLPTRPNRTNSTNMLMGVDNFVNYLERNCLQYLGDCCNVQLVDL